MTFSQLLAGVGLATSLLLTTTVSTARAQAPAAPIAAPAHLPPSVVGGKPTTLSVYNYTKGTLTPFWVDPNGVIQPVPDGKPVPPISGTKAFSMPTFVGATLVFKKQDGGGAWKHLYGKNIEPIIVVGTPDKNTPVPDRVAKRLAAKGTKGSGAKASTPGAKANAADNDDGDEGEIDQQRFARLSKETEVTVNNSTTPTNGRRRGRKSPDINITKIKVVPVEPAVFPTAPANGASPSSAPDAASPPAAAPPADDPASATEAPIAPKTKKPFTAESPVIVEFLRIHNAARADVGAGPLEWSPDLAKNAHNWAVHIAQTGRLEHQGDKYGENFGTGTGEDYTPATAANAWLSEKVNFKPDAADPYRVSKMYQDQDGKTIERIEDGPTAHYTQMVWSKSTMVGVGTARMKNGKLIVVAFYNPRGNVKDEKPY